MNYIKKVVNYIKTDKYEIIQTSTHITVNGKQYKLPNFVKSKNKTFEIVDGKIKINGFSFNPETGEFKSRWRFLKMLLKWT